MSRASECQASQPETVFVEFEIPFYIRTPNSIDNPEEAFHPQIDGLTAEIRLKPKANPENAIQISGAVEQDRFGKVSRTDVQVVFDSELISDVENSITRRLSDELRPSTHASTTLDEPDATYITRSVAFLNQFLIAYRHATRYYWIRPLSHREIISFSIIEFDSEGNENTYERQFHASPIESGILDDEDISDIEKKLSTGVGPHLYQELELSAYDLLSRINHNQAALYAGILFESWLKHAFVEILVARGESESDAKDTISNQHGDFYSVYNLASEKLESKLNYDFEAIDEFTHWNQDTRQLRNDIVHEGYQANVDEANEAIKASLEAIHRINQEFQSELHGTQFWMQLPTDKDGNYLQDPLRIDDRHLDF